MTTDKRSTFRCVRLAAAALALGFVTSASLAPVSAQDASPAAAVACVSPGLPPGTPTPMDDMAGMDMGTPMAVAEAEEAVTGTPADDATAATIFAEVDNYFACYNEGQASGDPGLYVALESNGFVASQGYATRYDEVEGELGSPFPVVTLQDVDNAMVWDDGRVSADVQAMVGDHWYNHWRWFLIEEDGAWKLDERADLPPTPDVDFVAVNGINITETTDEATGGITYAFESFSGSWDFVQTDAIIFNFSNSGEEAHEAIVAQLPEGADPMGLLDGSVDMSQVTFVGGVFDIEPGGSADLTLIGLEPGAYTLLCFYPSPDGAPHAAHGMVQQFNIVAPAA
ncbi:MAG: hypothetical protein R2848_02390 [Thermomicrobiales bacterium]